MPVSDAQTSAASVVRLNPPTMLDATEIGNSQISVVAAGRLAFVAGQTATPREGGAVPESLSAQAHIVATQLAAALQELKASARDVVAFRMYVVNASADRFEEAWGPIHEVFQGEMPSGTAIGVQALWTSNLQLEVEMVVRVP